MNSNTIKEFFIALAVAFVMSVGAYMTTVNVIEERLNSVKADVEENRAILKAVQENQRAIASGNARMDNAEDDIDLLKLQMAEIQSTRYTREDAQRTTDLILRELDAIKANKGS